MNNDNDSKVYELCENLRSITGLSKNQSYSFINLLSSALVHNVAVESAENCDGKLDNVDIYLPNIGMLHLSIDNGKVKSSSIDIDKSFKKQIEKAVNEFKSPLITKASEKTVEMILEKYKSVI